MTDDSFEMLAVLRKDLVKFHRGINRRLDVISQNLDLLQRHVQQLSLRTTTLESDHMTLTPLPSVILEDE